jgi:P pilus assembly chaperone PapD
LGSNLNITPKRLTLARGQRTATAHIFNRGAAPATFEISLVDRVMLESGEIRAAADSADEAATARLASARDMIMVSPRRVTLAPGKGQTIRIRVTAPAGVSAAEYRTHLTVTTLPPPGLGLTAENAAARRAGQLSFHVHSVFGVSIPIIVRPQAVTAQGEIRNVRLARGGTSPAALMFDLVRTGTGSLFGNVDVRARGKARLGGALGLGVYPEIAQRSVSIPLQRVPASGEELEIAFTDDDIKPGRVAARTTFRVP